MGNSISKGFAWTAIDRFSNLFIQFVLGVIIARLITPEEYGVLGILMVFINISQVFIDSGLGSALIYRNKIEDDYLNTSFVFNFCVSVILYLIIFNLSPIVESFFTFSHLSDYLRVSSLVLIVNSLIVVPTSLLKIRLNFKSLAITNIVSSVVSGILGISAAYHGYGVWALILQLISKSVSLLFFLYILCHWYPKFYYRKKVFIELYRYGVNIFSASCLTKFVDEGISFFIGKSLSPYYLGVYTRGSQFSSLPGSTIGGIISTALFPSLSAIKNDELHFKRVYKGVIEIQAFLCMPLFVWLATMAGPLVRLLITSKWIAVVPVIQILCLGKVLMPAANVTEQVLNAKGRSDLFFRQQLFKLIAKVVFISICIPFGLIAVVVGEALCTFLIFFITNFYARSVSDFRIIDQIKLILPYFFCALISGGFAYWTTILVENDFLIILIGSLVFITLYIFSLVLGCNKATMFRSYLQWVRTKLSR